MKSWEIIAKVYLEFLHTLGQGWPVAATPGSVTGRRNPTKSGRKRSQDFGYFDPSKSLAEGRKGALSRKQTSLTSQNCCVTRSATKRTQSVQNCMPTRSIGTIISKIYVLHECRTCVRTMHKTPVRSFNQLPELSARAMSGDAAVLLPKKCLSIFLCNSRCGHANHLLG
ncbi:hypothetical protein BV327_05681 [Pseudomonas syringae pv. actinidiae]|nr:hypothetical protein BV327_05681 [Pseudomonas syringae pv. actinidiae]